MRVAVLSVVTFWMLYYEYIIKIFVDWPLKFKTVNSFEDVQYKMYYKDFTYNIYIYMYIYIVELV